MKSALGFSGLFLFILTLFLPILSQVAVAAAATPIGQVVWVKGVVKATGPNGNRNLQRRSAIFNHDTLVTSKTGTGQVVFSDNSLIALSADTTLRIDEYNFGKNVPANQAKFAASLVKGGFRTITGLIPKQNSDNYQVNTPVATIGVRGTKYAIVYKGKLYVKYFNGSPCVKNEGGIFCLNSKNPYVGVNSFDSAPIRLSGDPGVFIDQPEIIPASFMSGPISPGSMTPGGGTIAPKGNSFCIQ